MDRDYQALCKWTSSVEAWNEALKCLPQTGELSEADKRLKIQFEEGLAKVKKAEAAENDPQMRTLKSTDKVPWKCAEEHIEQLRADKVQSSVCLNISLSCRPLKCSSRGLSSTMLTKYVLEVFRHH